MGRIVILLLFSFYFSNAYSQECHFQFNQNQINVNFNGDAISIPFYIDVQRPNNSSPSTLCDRAAFFFSEGKAASYNRKVYKNQNTIDYTLENTNPTGTLKALGDESGENEFLSTYININENKRLSGLFKIPTQNILGGAGHYQDVVRVTVVGYKSNSNYRVGMTKELVINVQTQTSINISIVPENAPYNSSSTSATLNFGQLTTGKELGADLIVKSNTGYRVRVGSQNNGQFRNYAKNANLPYEFRFAGTPVNLNGTSGNPANVMTIPGGSIPAGDRFNMKVKVGTVSGKPTGEYSDTITVSVIAQ